MWLFRFAEAKGSWVESADPKPIMTGRYGDLDYPTLAKRGTLLGLCLFAVGAAGELGVPEEFYTVKTDHVELAWWLLEEMVDEGDVGEGEIVEQYPTVDGTVVERTPLA